MKRSIQKIAVLGSGIMGSRIACHFANIGVNVLLLDIVPKELSDEEKKKGLNLDSPEVKNRIVNTALQATLKANPSPIYKKSFTSRIRTGNFTDNMKDIASCDWILEAVVENLDIKKSVFTEVEKFRKPGTLVTSNTSGIPIHLMDEGRSEDFQKHFCGTHFFNPPRYLRLLEIIPTPKTDPAVVEFLMNYGDLFLGKSTVLCKDTPAFIANRIGVFSIMSLFHLVEKMGLTIDDIDKLTGPVLGRPKSATFRTCDVVGLDTLVKVALDVLARCPNDESKDTFKLPAFVQKLVDNKWFGDKTNQGFYKKVKGEKGKSEILTLDLKTFEYKAKGKSRFPTLDQTKSIDNLKDRIKVLFAGTDVAGEFYRSSFAELFRYITYRIPEIADDIQQIDEAVCAGFGWEIGPFAIWDLLGIQNVISVMENKQMAPAPWVYEMLKKGVSSFYEYKNGQQEFYDLQKGSRKSKSGGSQIILLDASREKTVWKNAGCSLIDIGDSVLNLEFHTKMNTIGGEVIEGMSKAIDIAEKDFAGLVIGSEGQNFSAGANLAMIFMFATDQEFDEIDMAIRAFQNMNMRVRYSGIPVVVAPHALTLGGGCEMSLHADRVVASAETYIGLVEFGVGLIPGGGGSKEMTLRASDAYGDGNIDEQVLREYYLTIAMAKVSTSGHEAYDLKILRAGRDEVVINPKRVITDAKRAVLEIAADGYSKPIPRKDIKVLGRSGMGMFYAGANAMMSGNFISPHDQLISQKLATVMCGGDLSAPTLVSEQYLLDLEREAFLSLCGERKTLERIQSILTSGKPLRN
ncbi:MAG: enoyl-CoA hydratase/isomerase family protein [Bacteroidetes bacterium]|nr:enoyl-CoA hydratase/isomerase family protein [Bacteroidota bacterium]MBP6648100.1 enoyl-CoA hydratase/isomerase family protein [Bacteroidia bacterium]